LDLMFSDACEIRQFRDMTLKSSDFSSDLFLRSLRVSRFLVLSLFLVLHLKAAYNLTNWLIK